MKQHVHVRRGCGGQTHSRSWLFFRERAVCLGTQAWAWGGAPAGGLLLWLGSLRQPRAVEAKEQKEGFEFHPDLTTRMFQGPVEGEAMAVSRKLAGRSTRDQMWFQTSEG